MRYRTKRGSKMLQFGQTADCGKMSDGAAEILVSHVSDDSYFIRLQERLQATGCS